MNEKQGHYLPRKLNAEEHRKTMKSLSNRGSYSFLSKKGINTIFWISAVGHVFMTLIFLDNSDYTSYITDWNWCADWILHGIKEFILIWNHLPKLLFIFCFLLADYHSCG